MIRQCNTGLIPAMKMAYTNKQKTHTHTHTEQGLLHIREQATDNF
jgi:hypothetical protein